MVSMGAQAILEAPLVAESAPVLYLPGTVCSSGPRHLQQKSARCPGPSG
jgi:hypothetical protein